ncbi:MAG: phosphodiester glycosidase family protein [Bacteroidota bacterium]
MKYVLTLVLQVAVALYCFAQPDSLVFMHAKWQVKKIAPGIQLRQCWFNHSLYGSNQNISVLEVKLNKKNLVDVEADSNSLQPTSVFGTAHGALAAINGTFFDMKNGGSEDYIRINGKALNATRTGKSHNRSFHQKTAIVINGKNIRISKWDGSGDWESRLPGEDVMVTGPLLIEDHKRVALDTTGFYTMRHPRSAFAIKGKRVLLVTVDGRNQRAAGMTLYELAGILEWLDAGSGVNLDGGGSTTLWVNHFPAGGVINYPSDNKKMIKSKIYKPGTDLDNLAADEQKWDHTGERPVANVLLVSRKK